MVSRFAFTVLLGGVLLSAQETKLIEGKTYVHLEHTPDVIPLGVSDKASTPYLLDVYRAKDGDSILIGDYFQPQPRLKFYTIIYAHKFVAFDQLEISKGSIHVRHNGRLQTYSYSAKEGLLTIHDSKGRLVGCTTSDEVPEEMTQMNLFKNVLKKASGAKTAVGRRIAMVFALLQKEHHLPQVYLDQSSS